MAAFRLVAALAFLSVAAPAYAASMTDYPVVKLQSLDKISARTMTFEARVGSTVKFGSLYIKTQACRKTAPIEQPESAAFLQVWEVDAREEARWVFSGWMFASSPALSPMDHPVYDVWVLDCLDHKTGEEPIVPPLPAVPYGPPAPPRKEAAPGAAPAEEAPAPFPATAPVPQAPKAETPKDISPPAPHLDQAPAEPAPEPLNPSSLY